MHSGGPELAIQYASSLWRFWWMRGYYSEGTESISAALEHGFDIHDISKAEALNAAGIMEFSVGHLEKSLALHEEARKLSADLGAADELATSMDNIGIVNVVLGSVSEGIEAFEGALEHFRAANDSRARL